MTQAVSDTTAMARTLAELEREHRELDTVIAALGEAAEHDQVELARLKKRKLRLRDQIWALRDALQPDIIA